jgi:hypothetical protein
MLFLNFDLMIGLVANKLFLRLKFDIFAFLGFDLMIEVSTSWSKFYNIIEQIWSREKVEFQPRDHNFDLMKKLNFNLMKFDLLTTIFEVNFDSFFRI